MTTVSEVLAPLDTELGEVEAAIATEVENTGHPELAYICDVKGKRLRPSLVILTARLGDPDPGMVVNAAVGLEFLHVATLVHDDVIDNSDLRRGRPSLQKRIGRNRAIVVGDYYLAQGLQCLSRLGDSGLVDRASGAIMRICHGELTSVGVGDRPEVAEKAYFEKTKAKTSALLQVCTAAGSVAGNLSAGQAENVDAYAQELGIAFQIVDDLLDYVAEESVLGKPTGSDLREGTITLPLLRVLASSENGEELRLLAAKTNRNDVDVQQAVQLVRKSSALQDVWQEARAHADQAIASLTSFAPGPARESLEALCAAVVATR